MAQLAYNNSKSSSTGFSPAYLQFGQDARTPVAVMQSTAQPVVVSETATQMLDRMSATLETAKNNLEIAKEKQKKYADRRRREVHIEVGDQVLLSTENLSLPSMPVRKLRRRFIGPFNVVEKFSAVAVKLALPPHIKIHPVFHVDLLRLYRESTKFGGRKKTPPPPVEVDGEEEWHVEKFIGKRTFRGKLQYLVLWTGHPAYEATWREAVELEADMPVFYHRLVKEFNSRATPSQVINVAEVTTVARDSQDWQFDPAIFGEISKELGVFTLDA
jgi:glycosylphosphatidylinositol phospholipase D